MAVLYVRVPDELADMVRERAKASRRSMTQELIVLIERALTIDLTIIAPRHPPCPCGNPECRGGGL